MEDLLKSNIQNLIEEKSYSKDVQDILKLISNDKMYFSEIKAIMDESSSDKIEIKKELVNVVYDYIELCLKDGLVTKEELLAVKKMRLFFGIEEDDSYKFGIKARTEQLLTVELEKMYDDKVINDEEALTKVELQALFGLSYEDFYEIDKRIAQKSIKNGANMKDLGSYFDV